MGQTPFKLKIKKILYYFCVFALGIKNGSYSTALAETRNVRDMQFLLGFNRVGGRESVFSLLPPRGVRYIKM